MNVAFFSKLVEEHSKSLEDVLTLIKEIVSRKLNLNDHTAGYTSDK